MARSAIARLITHPHACMSALVSSLPPKSGLADADREHVCCGTKRERVGPGHPCSVAGDVAPSDRGDAEDGGDRHARSGGEPEQVEELRVWR
jgi:hypothetical protein